MLEKTEKLIEFKADVFVGDFSEIKTLTKEDVKVSLLEELAFNCYSYKNLASNLEKEKNKITAEKEKFQELMGYLMDLLEIKSYKSKSGTITKSDQPNYRLPQDDSSRNAFFAYLKERGVYDSMITVNANTLKSYIKAEVELAEAEGNIGFIPAGIEETEYRTVYSLRK